MGILEEKARIRSLKNNFVFTNREGIEVLEKADYNLTTVRENRNVLNA